MVVVTYGHGMALHPSEVSKPPTESSRPSRGWSQGPRNAFSSVPLLLDCDQRIGSLTSLMAVLANASFVRRCLMVVLWVVVKADEPLMRGMFFRKNGESVSTGTIISFMSYRFTMVRRISHRAAPPRHGRCFFRLVTVSNSATTRHHHGSSL